MSSCNFSQKTNICNSLSWAKTMLRIMSFVYFLGEVMVWQICFKINWPLKIPNRSLAPYLLDLMKSQTIPKNPETSPISQKSPKIARNHYYGPRIHIARDQKQYNTPLIKSSFFSGFLRAKIGQIWPKTVLNNTTNMEAQVRITLAIMHVIEHKTCCCDIYVGN